MVACGAIHLVRLLGLVVPSICVKIPYVFLPSGFGPQSFAHVGATIAVPSIYWLFVSVRLLKTVLLKTVPSICTEIP